MSRARVLLKTTLILAIAAAAILAIPILGRAQSGKNVIRTAMPATVMVMAVDVVEGNLEPVGSGSGTIVDADGSVVTNFHVIHDKEGSRLYDLFVIGRFRAADREPEMVCAGKPSRAKLKRELDLALLKCDMDMNGQPWKPSSWPSIPVGRSEEIMPGEQVWVLGYPNVGGNTIHVTAGLVSGWTGEHGGAGSRAFMKTDAAITHGNSGGTALNERGRFIGVPTAFRVSTAQEGTKIATVGQVGLIRPIEHVRDLIGLARRGWTPADGDHEVPEEASLKLDERSDQGVRLTSRVVDAANRDPVPGAFVILFKPGVQVADLEGAKLGEQALAWGQTNDGGSFTLQQPVPRGTTYAVAVLASGYQPMAADSGVKIDEDAPDLYDPWGEIRMDRE